MKTKKLTFYSCIWRRCFSLLKSNTKNIFGLNPLLKVTYLKNVRINCFAHLKKKELFKFWRGADKLFIFQWKRVSWKNNRKNYLRRLKNKKKALKFTIVINKKTWVVYRRPSIYLTQEKLLNLGFFCPKHQKKTCENKQ